MARPPLRELLRIGESPRGLATRSLGLLSSAASYLKEAGPLLLTIRAANELARRILEQPSPTATPAQRRTLLAAGAQLRALTSRIIISADGRDPHSVEAELAELIRRTLTLIDRVTADSPELANDRSRVIDTEGWIPPRLPPDDEG